MFLSFGLSTNWDTINDMNFTDDTLAWTPRVTWQQTTIAWDDDDYDTWADWKPAKLSKKARKKLRKAEARRQRAAALRLAEMRQVTLDQPRGKLKLIFCDFDGVLNRQAKGGVKLLPELVERLDRLARQTGAVVIVSSWWRCMGMDWCRRDLRAAGLRARVIGRTPWLGKTEAWDAYERGTEIQAVLDYLGDRVRSYVILDDHDRMGDLLPNLVQTDATEGLSEADVEIARAILDGHRPVRTLRAMSTKSLTDGDASSYTAPVARDGAAKEMETR